MSSSLSSSFLRFFFTFFPTLETFSSGAKPLLSNTFSSFFTFFLVDLFSMSRSTVTLRLSFFLSALSFLRPLFLSSITLSSFLDTSSVFFLFLLDFLSESRSSGPSR
ncbi:hypothetical protein V8G54_026368 [Vigna mungo]|uniref:Uncharacterized protein n=1 Tax=Vigna mungo TaxID=3915 RepID=A0AAQ3MZZ5_VIGMU